MGPRSSKVNPVSYVPVRALGSIKTKAKLWLIGTGGYRKPDLKDQ